MSKNNLVVDFLNVINSESVQSGFSSLVNLLQELEVKNDPNPVEMEIVDSAYQVIEKLNILQSALTRYKSSDKLLTGNKLSSLYEKNNDNLFE